MIEGTEQPVHLLEQPIDADAKIRRSERKQLLPARAIEGDRSPDVLMVKVMAGDGGLDQPLSELLPLPRLMVPELLQLLV